MTEPEKSVTVRLWARPARLDTAPFLRSFTFSPTLIYMKMIYAYGAEAVTFQLLPMENLYNSERGTPKTQFLYQVIQYSIEFSDKTFDKSDTPHLPEFFTISENGTINTINKELIEGFINL